MIGLFAICFCFLGIGLTESGPADCMFRALIEYVMGMKFSIITQAEGISITALHQSSGNYCYFGYFSSLRFEYCQLCFAFQVLVVLFLLCTSYQLYFMVVMENFYQGW